MRSSTQRSSARSRLRCCAGDSATSKTTKPAPAASGLGLDLLDLAGADVEGRVRAIAAHGNAADRLDAGRLDQLPQFLGGVGIVPAPDGDTDQEGALRAARARPESTWKTVRFRSPP